MSWPFFTTSDVLIIDWWSSISCICFWIISAFLLFIKKCRTTTFRHHFPHSIFHQKYCESADTYCSENHWKIITELLVTNRIQIFSSSSEFHNTQLQKSYLYYPNFISIGTSNLYFKTHFGLFYSKTFLLYVYSSNQLDINNLSNR